MRTLVIGGGISGLTLAHGLRARARPGDEVVVLERGSRVGGHAVTLEEHGYRVETGPNGFLTREPAALELVESLGLGPRLVEASRVSRRRYIVRHGRLCRVPDSPPALLTSGVLSAGGKLRLMLEPFAPPPPADRDESVYEFACRRVGREAAEVLVDTAIAGITAGDSRELSLASAFPLMREMEREHGSLIRAMIARVRAGRIARLVSFPTGMAELTGALAADLGDAVRLGVTVERLERVTGPGGATAVWRAVATDERVWTAERVVIATPAWAASALLADHDPALATALAAIPFGGVAVVALAYPVRQLPRALDGYGYLVSRHEGLATLGVVWESSLFPGRAPEGRVLLRAILGGARQPDLAELPAEDVARLARRDLDRVMGVGGLPERSWVFRWPRAIAQYTRGHAARVAAIRGLAARHHGLVLAGTSYDGVSFTSAIAAATALAARLSTEPGGPSAHRPRPGRHEPATHSPETVR